MNLENSNNTLSSLCRACCNTSHKLQQVKKLTIVYKESKEGKKLTSYNRLKNSQLCTKNLV